MFIVEAFFFQKQRVLWAEHAQTKSAPKPLQNTLHGKRALGCNIPKIKIVMLSVRQLRHVFTKKVKVSPNLTVAHLCFGTADIVEVSSRSH